MTVHTSLEYPVRFSLVLATVDRVAELDRMISSLAAQKYSNYELIVVDQNADNRLVPLVARWRSIVPCLHIRSSKGLSRARNAGIAHARGEFLSFPDDDGWYHDNFLLEVHQWFQRNPEYSLLSTCVRDETGIETATRWPQSSCIVDRRSLHMTCTSIGLFVRQTHAQEVGGFDERMGIGSGTPFQSAEDLDFAHRIFQRYGDGWFERSIFSHHPRNDGPGVSPRRALAYGTGFGYLLRKHRYGMLVWLYHIARALLGVARALCFFRIREAVFHAYSVRGRIAGFYPSKSLN
jgi:glycosyltransferase involved in cell wall biosynthesis